MKSKLHLFVFLLYRYFWNDDLRNSSWNEIFIYHVMSTKRSTTDRKVFQLSHALFVFITWWLKPKLWSLKCHVKFSFLLSIVWSLVRRRVTRRLSRLQAMYNVLKYRKIWWNYDEKSIYRNLNATAPEPEISSI